MPLCQFKKLVCVAVLTTLIVASEASLPQSSTPSLLDEIQKAKSIVDGGRAALHDNTATVPEFDTQISVPHQLEDSLSQQEQSPQEQEFGALASPEQSSFFQGAMQEMSNLLASNRKLRHDLYVVQKREGDEQKRSVKVNEELTNIAHMVEASNKRIAEEEEKAVARANEDLKHSKTELEVSNGELLGTKTKLVAANSELQTINEKLQGINKEVELANGKLQSTNSELQKKLESANEELISKLELASQNEKQMELAKVEAEQKALKAEKEAELMASQMRTAQLSMQRTQDMVRKLFPSIKQKRGQSSQQS